MKKIVQNTGRRLYLGDDFLLMQNNGMEYLKNLISPYGDKIIINGLQRSVVATGDLTEVPQISGGNVLVTNAGVSEIYSFDGATLGALEDSVFVRCVVTPENVQYEQQGMDIGYNNYTLETCEEGDEGAFDIAELVPFKDIVGSANHEHTKSQITDFGHQHPASDITGLTFGRSMWPGFDWLDPNLKPGIYYALDGTIFSTFINCNTLRITMGILTHHNADGRIVQFFTCTVYPHETYQRMGIATGGVMEFFDWQKCY